MAEGSGTAGIVIDPPVKVGAWVGHQKFAAWLVEKMRPQCIVELGAYEGGSFFAFCEAVKVLGLDCECFAVDTWKGDAHSGFYGDDVFKRVALLAADKYPMAYLARTTFDEAARWVPVGNLPIDILHIDGLHTYEAVKHDFETWLPKMSEKGIVLLHDTQAKLPGFGVDRFFAELQAKYKTFEFLHSYGLGVVAVGEGAIMLNPELFGAVAHTVDANAVRKMFGG